MKTRLNKKMLSRVCCIAAFLLIMGICVFAMRSLNSGTPLKTEADTTIIKETSTVAVTDQNGETVTDKNGEQVFDVVEVTKIAQVTTMEKQGFFDKIFNSTSKKSQENEGKDGESDSTATTKTQSFFDKLFGKNEEDTTSSSSTIQKDDTTIEEYGTTETAHYYNYSAYRNQTLTDRNSDL
ncbi:MAG: hypothetical protein ACI4VW_02775 [Acutalibacteraceae bacterium]